MRTGAVPWANVEPAANSNPIHAPATAANMGLQVNIPQSYHLPGPVSIPVTLKPISNVANGLDVPRMPRILLDLGAQRRHASIHAAIVDHDVVAPHRIQDLIPRQ